MITKLTLSFLLVLVTSAADTCLRCICIKESHGCNPIGCNPDKGSLSCGYYQIKQDYYIDCGQPGKKSGESTETAWKRCADDYTCATTCVQNYFNKYKGQCSGLGMGDCQIMARNHNGGPKGCKVAGTVTYWNDIKSCCGCS